MDPWQTRDALATEIRRLLLGPFSECETLELPRTTPTDPTDVYLTGILWPRHTTLSREDDDSVVPAVANDEGDTPSETAVPLFSIRKPASIGLTCTLEGADTPFEIVLRCAMYEPAGGQDEEAQAGDTRAWQRRPFEVVVPVAANESSGTWPKKDFSGPHAALTGAVELHVRRRVRPGFLMVTVSLVNARSRKAAQGGEDCLYQTQLEIRAGSPGQGLIVARPSGSGLPDEDLESGQLLFRGREEFAVGHGVGASWPAPANGRVHRVSTEWIPSQVVQSVSRNGHGSLAGLAMDDGAGLSAQALGDPDGRPATLAVLRKLCDLYGNWIRERENEAVDLPSLLLPAAQRHLEDCRKAHRRMEEGVLLLGTRTDAFRAFCLANQAMHRQSIAAAKGHAARPLVWYPFQVAFLLLAIPSVVDEGHADRRTLDLLWFPTGGGKTEAYLGLTAFAIFHRRLQGSGSQPHVDVLMRYTLRLLTVQQFQRAATLICSVELLRRENAAELGSVPVSIGLYVGQGATPNNLEQAQNALDDEARGGHPPSTPRLLLACPLCGAPLPPSSYRIAGTPRRMDVTCGASECPSRGSPLNIFTVDEDIYRQRPSLVIATVDKFAQLPRKQEVGLLFGRPDGIPPSLIIQDELHLISGPLGTVTGLYEACIELLCGHGGPPPKVIGSTATIGRARPQVRALFDRDVLQFPPPGLDAGDSFFAVTDAEAPDRLYMGISSSGRSPKFTLQATIASCLMAVEAARMTGAADADIDPFWTAMVYFNSLRELGGATVLIRDDVSRQAAFFAHRLGIDARQVAGEPTEITSRVPSTKIPQILKDLERSLTSDPLKGEPVDVALASSMISVGMDIPRLGLMVVNGQPKAMAEYIQATSRVGRGVPGLVLTVFNHARPRDVSHFEHFAGLHQTLYRRVEVASVTPWSPRARDRALHAVFIAAMRHLDPQLGERFAARDFQATAPLAVEIRDRILQRAASCRGAHVNLDDLATELDVIIDRWNHRAAEARRNGTQLEYWATLKPFDHTPSQPHLMRGAEEPDATKNAWVWPTPNSMRDVEPAAYYTCWGYSAPPATTGPDTGGTATNVGSDGRATRVQHPRAKPRGSTAGGRKKP